MSHKQQDYTEFMVDLSQLTRERPLGVSGILRCQNSADFLDACIESCIEGLDELIAVYHNCTDATADILKEKATKYPNKIKVFEYLPYIYPIDLADEQFEETANLAGDSIYLLSGYTNYAISKVSYRYAIKIDSDQIFFAEKFKELCDAYRSCKQVWINPLEIMAYNIYCYYERNYGSGIRIKTYFLDTIATLTSSFYFSFLKKKIIQSKVMVSLSGINLHWENNKWMIALGEKDIDTTYRDILCPFNGVRDLFFFEVCTKMTYNICHLPKTHNYSQVLEVMYHNAKTLDGGFIWFHLRPCLRKHYEIYQQWYNKVPWRFCSLNYFNKYTYQTLKKYLKVFVDSRIEGMFSYFYSVQRKSIPWDNLKMLCGYIQNSETIKTRMIDTSMYMSEFEINVKVILNKYIARFEVLDENKLMLGEHSVNESLFSYLYSFVLKERDSYVYSRLQGKSIVESTANIKNYFEHFNWKKNSDKIESLDIKEHPWFSTLMAYKGCCLAYVTCNIQTEKVIKYANINQIITILLILEYELDDKIVMPENIIVVEKCFSDYKCFVNQSVETNFPYLFYYANTFKSLFLILHPNFILCDKTETYKEILFTHIAFDMGIEQVQLVK